MVQTTWNAFFPLFFLYPFERRQHKQVHARMTFTKRRKKMKRKKSELFRQLSPKTFPFLRASRLEQHIFFFPSVFLCFEIIRFLESFFLPLFLSKLPSAESWHRWRQLGLRHIDTAKASAWCEFSSADKMRGERECERIKPPTPRLRLDRRKADIKIGLPLMPWKKENRDRGERGKLKITRIIQVQ